MIAENKLLISSRAKSKTPISLTISDLLGLMKRIFFLNVWSLAFERSDDVMLPTYMYNLLHVQCVPGIVLNILLWSSPWIFIITHIRQALLLSPHYRWRSWVSKCLYQLPRAALVRILIQAARFRDRIFPLLDSIHYLFDSVTPAGFRVPCTEQVLNTYLLKKQMSWRWEGMHNSLQMCE